MTHPPRERSKEGLREDRRGEVMECINKAVEEYMARPPSWMTVRDTDDIVVPPTKPTHPFRGSPPCPHCEQMEATVYVLRREVQRLRDRVGALRDDVVHASNGARSAKFMVGAVTVSFFVLSIAWGWSFVS